MRAATGVNGGPLARRRVLAAAAAAALLAAVSARAQPERARESLVKAAFLHKFPSFVEWPAGTFASAAAPLRIGVLGDDQVARDLRELAREREREGRTIEVVRLAPGDSPQGLHVLYVRSTSTGRIADLLVTVPDRVLTVADSDGAHPPGSVISFFTEDGRVRLAVSLEAATRQRLRVSSRMLSVARMVPG
nr:YfiR family protein [Ramlibacter albus]